MTESQQQSGASGMTLSKSKSISALGAGILRKLTGSIASDSFRGFQEDNGFFTKTRVNLTLTVGYSTQTFALEGGVSTQIPKRIFKLNEITQICYFNTNCTNPNNKAASKLICMYTMVFLFKTAPTLPEVYVTMEKAEFKRFSESVLLNFENEIKELRTLFLIKQHNIPKPKQLSYAQGSSMAANHQTTSVSAAGPRRKSVHQPGGIPHLSQRQLTKEQEMVKVRHDILENGIKALTYHIQIRKVGDTEISYSRQIHVSYSIDNQSCEVRVSDKTTVFELMWVTTLGCNNPRKLQVRMRGGHDWEIEFPNIYKAYQFLEQQNIYRLFQLAYRNISIIPPELKDEELHATVEVYSVTWNMARTHQEPDFNKLFPNHTKYNVIVYGVQECVRKERRIQADALKQHLGSDYIEIAFVDMWEMLLVAFIKRTDVIFMSGKPIINYTTLGVMNVIGNKGGILLQFELHGKVFSFVNCHLASGANKAEARQEMLAQVLRQVPPVAEKEKLEPDALAHFNFILGDLNMRFKSTFLEQVKQVETSHQRMEELDEMHESRFQRGRYPLYDEEQINFQPTYKRDQFANGIFINKNDQCPSFTDRILFKGNCKWSKVEQNAYGCSEDVFGSDHRPVYLHSTIKIYPSHYMNPKRLMRVKDPIQGRGELVVLNPAMQLHQARLGQLKRNFKYPLFFQLGFKSDWLANKPSSYEKRIMGWLQQNEFPIKTWKNFQIPKLFTPINCSQALQSKWLTVVILMVEGTNTVQENFAYVNLHLDKMTEEADGTFSKVFQDVPIIGYNAVLGTFSCIINYQIVDQEIFLIEDSLQANQEQGNTPKDSSRKKSLTLSDDDQTLQVSEMIPGYSTQQPRSKSAAEEVKTRSQSVKKDDDQPEESEELDGKSSSSSSNDQTQQDTNNGDPTTDAAAQAQVDGPSNVDTPKDKSEEVTTQIEESVVETAALEVADADQVETHEGQNN